MSQSYFSFDVFEMRKEISVYINTNECATNRLTEEEGRFENLMCYSCMCVCVEFGTCSIFRSNGFLSICMFKNHSLQCRFGEVSGECVSKRTGNYWVRN